MLYEESILNIIKKVNSIRKEISKIELLKKKEFYVEFHAECDVVNEGIERLKSEYSDKLENLDEALKKRKDSLFTRQKLIDNHLENNYQEIKQKYDLVYFRNSNYEKKLEEKKRRQK